jgi:sugar lactone lactonase YvrE
MKRLFSLIQIVLFSLLTLPTVPTLRAAPSPAAALLYLPIVQTARLNLNDAVSAIEPAAAGNATTFHTPMDATPDPDGNQIYFTAMSAKGAGVFRVPAAGGTVVTLTVGLPLTTLVGLAVSTDGQTLYLADTQAAIAGAQAVTKTGVLFTLPSSGGVPTPIAGTAHTAPRGLAVVKENNVDVIYFTGSDPADGQPAVMRILAAGGALTVEEKGEGLVEPVGIAVSKTGAIYIADQAATGNGLGTLFRFKPHSDQGRNRHSERLVEHVRMGSPAGITLTFDESLVLVSSLDTNSGTAQVLVVNTATKAQGIVNKVIGVNHSAGGLHRAHHNNVMAWADVTSGNGGLGTVFRVRLP